MKIIELAGSSGVGKSTLYEALGNHSHSGQFIFSDEKARYIITRQILKEINSFNQYFFIPGIKIPLINNFLCRKILDGKYKMSY
jgi:ABC-type transport system involved in cytochrome bd biosynthesis fused ATPase/permease subunit